MIEIYLAVDFGSTYTKITAFDLKNREVLSTAKALTTIKTDVMIGYKKALEKIIEDIEKNLKKDEYKIVYKRACSSAAGGLKIIAIGLVPELTTAAAKKTALSAGGRVVKTFGFYLTDDNITEIKNTEYDMILLSGGTDGGNREYVLANAKKISENNISKPIIFAGNYEVKDEIKKIFEKKNLEFYLCENVMPVVNKLNIEPVREIIRQVFMKNIVKAKGMENVQKDITDIVMPTPTAVLKAAEIFSRGVEEMNDSEKKDLGDVIVVDIGGATTDIHSVGDGLPKDDHIQLNGMEEPYLKRTVEGDLGMRYSAMSLYEVTSLNKIRTYLNLKLSKMEIKEEFKYREEFPDFVAKEEEDLIFDEMMAMICTEISMNRHTGMLEAMYSPMGTLFVQTGKDLTNVKYIIGTGGVIINNRNPYKILDKAIYNENEPILLKPKYPKYLIDKKYIMSALGVLAMDFPEIAFDLMKKYLIEL